MELTKPARLERGDRIAVVTPSWGGPAEFPAVYAAGRHALELELGLEVVEMPHALADAAWIARNPEARAEDIHRAFRDPSIRAVVTSIGGEDAIRLMPYLDLSAIAANPKVFLGFSDTTVLHFACLKAGLASFYGPNVMPGLAMRTEPFDYGFASLQRTLFDPHPAGRIEPNRRGWTRQIFELIGSSPGDETYALHPSEGPRVLQGRGIARGPLIGGCAEVLEMLKGTAWWPPLETWRGAIFFYEAYSAPTPAFLTAWLRNFAAQGILQLLNGIVLGRPGEVALEVHAAHDAALRLALEEIGLSDLPVLANLDFGHTDPVFTMPYGAMAEIDCDSGSFSITESGVESDG
jgi:muramoyltetrapeptide carboxypeptidase LdcA involved in peptidoglycan recycling